MFNSASVGFVIAVIVIMLILKPLLKSIADAFGKGYQDDEDSKK